MSTDYGPIAAHYDGRYALHDYSGVSRVVQKFAGAYPRRVLEVGCGTGHWLSVLSVAGHEAYGADRSTAMLARARQVRPDARLVLAAGESLPFQSEAFDRVLIVNALHHFKDPFRALNEARRVLRASGQLMIVGLQPRAPGTDWAVYSYFDGTRERDLELYADDAVLGDWLHDAGFSHFRQQVAQTFDSAVPARTALSSGLLAKHTTSQLAQLSDRDYEAGLAKIDRAASHAEACGRPLLLVSRIVLRATIAAVGEVA
jgi:ubiquinone/menaquinone biosynthesis C-methylase UbiE